MFRLILLRCVWWEPHTQLWSFKDTQFPDCKLSYTVQRVDIVSEILNDMCYQVTVYTTLPSCEILLTVCILCSLKCTSSSVSSWGLPTGLPNRLLTLLPGLKLTPPTTTQSLPPGNCYHHPSFHFWRHLLSTHGYTNKLHLLLFYFPHIFQSNMLPQNNTDKDFLKRPQ